MTDATGSAVSAMPGKEGLPETVAPATNTGVRVMQNTAVVFLGRGLGLVLAGAATFFLIRTLNSEQLGQYGAIYAYLTLFGWLASFGIGPLLAREAAQNREHARSIMFTAVCITAGFAVATAAIALAIAPLARLSGSLLPLLAIASVEIFLLAPASLFAVIFQVDQRQWYSSSFSIVRQILWFGVMVAIYWAGAPLLYIVLGRLGVAVVEAGLNWRFAQKFLDGPRNFLPPMAQKLLRGGFVVTLVTVASTIYLRIDQVMLHSMVGDGPLGHYVVAVKISELFEALPAAFGSAMFPLLCVSVADMPRFRRHMDIGYRYMVLAGSALSVAFCLGARPLIHLVAGAKHAESSPMLAVLIWSEIPIFFAATLGNGLLASGLQRISLWPAVAGAAVNIGLNLFLIPRYGALGASWATVIAYWTCWTLVFLPIRASREMFWIGFRLLIPITALALAVSGLASLLPANDWVRLGVGLAGFVILARLFGFARKQDVEFIRSAWRTRLGTRAA